MSKIIEFKQFNSISKKANFRVLQEQESEAQPA